MKEITAIVPAGGRLAQDDARLCGEDVKALLTIDGQSLLARLLRVLNAMENIGGVVVVGPDGTRQVAEQGRALWVAETSSLLGNVQAGVRAAGLSGQNRILLIGSDLAAPTAMSLADFLARAPSHAGVSAPLITQERFETTYPNSPSAFLALREGRFTLGSQFTAPAGLLLDPTPAIAAMLGHRKSQLGMALTFGLPFAFGLLTGRLTVPLLERRASQLLRVPSVAVPNCAPDLALDIDNADDYRYACALESKKQLIEANPPR